MLGGAGDGTWDLLLFPEVLCAKGWLETEDLCFPQPPTSLAALGSSCVTVACVSTRAGAAMVMRTVMTSLMNATAVSWGSHQRHGGRGRTEEKGLCADRARRP